MKILQINAVYGKGSTGAIVRDISDALIKSGHESHIMWATGCKTDNTTAKLIRIGSTLDHKLHALLRRIDGGQGMHSRLATKRVCKKILEIAPDVVHLHNLHSNYIHLPMLLNFLAKHNIPTLITMHDCWFVGAHCMHYIYHNCEGWLTDCRNCPAVTPRLRKSVAKRFAERKNIYSKFDNLAVNGVSEWTTEAAKRSILGTAKHIKRIYNWVDTKLFCPKDNANAVKARYGISENKKLILGVSQSWSQGKGLNSFIHLSSRLSDVAEIILIGADNGVPVKDNLRCIGFTANVDELVELYSAADVLVNASEAETFGLVTVEAMACGTPVVAYNNSGSKELVSDAVGALAEDGNIQALYEGVIKILSNGKERYSSSCRRHVCENFEKNAQVQKYIDFYKEILLTAEVSASTK